MKYRNPLRLIVASLGSAAALGLTFAPTGMAAEAGAGTAVSTGGLVADVAANTITNTQVFDFKMVVPTGTCAGGSLVPGVDFCKPWAALAIARHGEGAGGGLGGGVTCSAVVNPERWSAGAPVMNPRWGQDRPVKPRNGIFADVPCDDGEGYNFYRVVIDDRSDADGPWGLFDGQVWGVSGTSALSGAPITWTWGAYKGLTKFAHDNGASQVGDATVYGVDGRGAHVLATAGAAKVFPVAAEVVTTAGGADVG